MSKGIIIKGIGGLYSVYSEGKIYSCKARGVFRKNGLKPSVGDYAEISEIDEQSLTAVIDDILERRNFLIRPAVANVDRIVFVIAAKSPDPDFMLIDRLMAAARQKNLEVGLVINKSDRNSNAANEIARSYKNAVDRLFVISAIENTGTEELKEYLSNGVTVLAGQSGVGKSSITNLVADDVSIETGELTKKLERGKHTTRHNEIFPVNGGFIIDSPGFSMFDLENVEPLDLMNYYPELKKISGCYFADCSHSGEKGCGVRTLIDNELISPERYERYIGIYKELVIRKKNKYR